VLAQGASYRAKDAELVRFEAPWARLDAHTIDGQRTVKIVPTASHDAATKTYEIDGQKLTRLHATKTLPVVLFEPNHLVLLSGPPDIRRAFMDDLIEQMQPSFAATRRHYRRVLSQRNALLKKNPSNLPEQLFVWNVRLSELGGQIAKLREQLIVDSNQQLSERYSSLADRPYDVALRYVSRFSSSAYETELLHKLERSVELDVLRGFTAYGPHRDDLEVSLNGHLAQESASRGETRTLVLALKMMELEMIESARNVRPLLLLDDVFSELDSQRRHALTGYVDEYQTFITTTDADVVAHHFASSKVIDPTDRA
jgi:DNA replication and repair protein RecF